MLFCMNTQAQRNCLLMTNKNNPKSVIGLTPTFERLFGAELAKRCENLDIKLISEVSYRQSVQAASDQFAKYAELPDVPAFLQAKPSTPATIASPLFMLDIKDSKVTLSPCLEASIELLPTSAAIDCIESLVNSIVGCNLIPFDFSTFSNLCEQFQYLEFDTYCGKIEENAICNLLHNMPPNETLLLGFNGNNAFNQLEKFLQNPISQNSNILTYAVNVTPVTSVYLFRFY